MPEQPFTVLGEAGELRFPFATAPDADEFITKVGVSWPLLCFLGLVLAAPQPRVPGVLRRLYRRLAGTPPPPPCLGAGMLQAL